MNISIKNILMSAAIFAVAAEIILPAFAFGKPKLTVQNLSHEV